MKMRGLAKPDPKAPPPPSLPSDKWVVLDSAVLGERIMIIRHKRWLPEARKTHPELVIYFPQEIQKLERFKGSHEDIRAIHLVKKQYKAWLIR